MYFVDIRRTAQQGQVSYRLLYEIPEHSVGSRPEPVLV